MSEKVRLDKYLWAIRLFKTRTQAATAIDNGKVKMDGALLKSSKSVNIGERYSISTEARKWVIEVTGLLEKRVQFSEAVKHYTDQTPPELLAQKLAPAFYENTGKRQSKQGRPTKKNRRDWEELSSD